MHYIRICYRNLTMSNIDLLKKRLSMSTTMPAGTAGSPAEPYMMGSAHQGHDHTVSEGNSCCDDESCNDNECSDDEDECLEDNTNPSGGCGCC